MTIDVLLLEDNPGDARLVQELLWEAAGDGVRVKHTTRLAEGLQYLSEHTFDVALLDLGLPDAQGLEGLAQVLSAFPDIPIVVLTGSDDAELAVNAVKSGAQDYLIKGPGNGDLLLRAIRYAIERTRSHIVLRELAQAVSSVTGQAFFNTLVGQLCRHFDAAYAFVAELDQDTPPGIRTIAMQAHGKIVDNVSFALAGSPCDLVASGQACRYNDGVQQAYPGNELLKEFDIDSYMGVPLVSSEGTVMGMLVAMDSKPWNNNLPGDQFLQVFAGRTMAELERRKTEATMRKLAGAMEQTADSVFITDRDGVIEYVNATFEKTTGYGREEAVGQTLALLDSDQHGSVYRARMWSTLADGEMFRDTVVHRRKNGAVYHMELTVTPLRDPDGKLTHYLTSGRDITDHLRTQEQIHALTYLNPLTGLPNRTLFMDRLGQLLARSRWQSRAVALLFLNLDRFKAINDTLGDDVGDQALRLMAERVQSGTRKGDTVAHLGGDHFAVILQDVASVEDLPQIAEGLLAVVAGPVQLFGGEFVITASIGIALSPQDGNTVQDLMAAADSALAQAKNQGGNSARFFENTLGEDAFESLSLASSLHGALERDEFRLLYQPQYHAYSRRIVGMEALLRWMHPDKGMLPPDRFIPMLEKTGMIVPVGEWVLQTACRQIRDWEMFGITTRVAVNLSARQLSSPTLVATVARILQESGLGPRQLELEVTESMLMQDIELSADALEALARMGVTAAIDDYGTGYSSLAYLKRLHVDVLKIDRSFVNGIGSSQDDEAIVASTISMAHQLGLKVVAEGVETEGQMEFLRSNACDELQGYFFSRPVPADEMLALLRRE